MPGSTRAAVLRRCPPALRGTDTGQISVLLVGLVAVALSIVLGVLGATSVQLGRIHLLDAADAAALDASDALAEQRAYAEGLGPGVPVTDATVAQAATEHLAARALPGRLSGWAVSSAGTPDGRTAVVTLTGTARIPGAIAGRYG